MNHLSVLSLALCAMLAASSTASAQTQIGYTTGNMGRSTVFHYGTSAKQGLAIRLSHDKLQALKGQTIKGIYTAFGSANAVANKEAILFIATNPDDEPVTEQSYTIGSANRWCTIDLDSPYTISGDEDELYIGYTLLSSSDKIPEALQSDFSNEQRACSFAWNGYGWEDLYGTGFGSANIRAILSGDVDFADVMLSDIDFADNYYLAGAEYQHTTHIFNFGTTPITSLDVTVQVAGKAQTITYNGLNVAQYGTFEFNLPALSSSESASTSIEVSVKANGVDEADTNDNEFKSTAFFYPAFMERNILVEEFTGMTCSNCPAGQRTLQTAVEQSQLPCVEIMHHSGYSADFYSTDADWDYTIYYGSASTFAPAAMINRVVNPAVSQVPIINIGLANCLSSLQLAATRQPYVSLALESSYDEETRQVDITLNILDHNDLPGATLLNAFLVQDNIIGYQANGGTDYVHNGVLRQVLTGNSWGMLLPDDFAPGNTQEWTKSFTLPDAIMSDFWTPSLLAQASYTEDMVTLPTDPEHMRIVVYVANYDNKDINNNMVYNCIEVPLINGSCRQAGMDAANALEQIGSEAPATSHCFDLSGRRINNSDNLTTGFYILDGEKVIIR